jgi:hypothetical protein
MRREKVDPLFDAEAGSPHLALEQPIDLLVV